MPAPDLSGEFVINNNNLQTEGVGPVPAEKPTTSSSLPPTGAINKAHFFSNFCLYTQNLTF